MADTSYCWQCGAQINSSAPFCSECGAKQELAEPPTADLSWNSMPVVAGAPLELWIAAAALGLSGLWLLGVAIKSFVNFIQGYNKLIHAYDKFRAEFLDSSNSEFSMFFHHDHFVGHRWEVANLISVTLLIVLALAMVIISWRLRKHKRVARTLTYAITASLITSVIFGHFHPAALSVALIAAIVSSLLLAFAPPVEAFLEPHPATSPAAAGVLAIAIGAWGVARAVSFALVANFKTDFLIAAIGLGLLGLGFLYVGRSIGSGNHQARLLTSCGGVLYIVIQFVFGTGPANQFLARIGPSAVLGLIVTMIVLMWVPSVARRKFGDQPPDFSS